MNEAIVLDGQLDSLLDRLGNILQARERQHGAHLHGCACVNFDRAEWSCLKAEWFILAASCRERREECDVEYSVSHWCISPDGVGQRRKYHGLSSAAILPQVGDDRLQLTYYIRYEKARYRP